MSIVTYPDKALNFYMYIILYEYAISYWRNYDGVNFFQNLNSTEGLKNAVLSNYLQVQYFSAAVSLNIVLIYVIPNNYSFLANMSLRGYACIRMNIY